jgi:hypothetical protein
LSPELDELAIVLVVARGHSAERRFVLVVPGFGEVVLAGFEPDQFVNLREQQIFATQGSKHTKCRHKLQK